MNTIYKATNKINGKSYIGFDSAWPKRMSRHLENANYNREGKFYDAIRKYGWDKFQWEILYQSEDKEHTLNVMETQFIREYNTFNQGYNMTGGGEGCFGATSNKIWINDGHNHKRLEKDQLIPEGWTKGRLKVKRKVGMSDESKQRIGQKNKGKLINGKNPAAKKIIYNGQEYYSIRHAAESNNTSKYFIMKQGTLIS
jgi:group I intron endonuclease